MDQALENMGPEFVAMADRMGNEGCVEFVENVCEILKSIRFQPQYPRSNQVQIVYNNPHQYKVKVRIIISDGNGHSTIVEE